MVPVSAIGVDLIIYTLLALWYSAQVHATLINITIDDTNSTFWTWEGTLWNAVTPSTPCPKCFAQPDPGQAYNSTWHDGTLLSGAFTFRGAAVYIYGIDVLVAQAGNISFAITDSSTTGFHYGGGGSYVYNSLFFSASNLDSTVQHTVTWQIEATSVGATAGLFDYAVVTLGQPDSSSSQTLGESSPSGSSTAPSESATPTASPAAPGNAHTAAIVGAVVGAVGGLTLFSALFIFLRRRRVAATSYSIEAYPPPERANAPLAPALMHHGPFFSGTSSLSSPPVSTPTSTPVSMASTPVPSRSISANSNSRVPHAPGAMALAQDPHHRDGGHGDLEMEARLRLLEDLIALQASRPPPYH